MATTIPSFFRAYDVRGLYGSDITEDVAYRIGKSICEYLGGEGNSIIVARDTRTGSDKLASSLKSGITESGCSVVDVGRLPSPLLYYSASELKSSAGIIVTASHLPPEWNGFKFCDKLGQVISEGYGLEKIANIYINNKFGVHNSGDIVAYTHILDDYYATAKTLIRGINNNLKVTVDTSNSVPSLAIPYIFKKFGIQSNFINDMILDYPIHELEPGLDSMKMLSEEVRNNGSDLGLIYDSDGDRVALVDEKGNIYPDGVTLIALFSLIYAEKYSEGSIVLDVTCPTSLLRFIEKLGFKILLSRVGHNFCSSKALKNNSLFAAQFSGHISLKESLYRDDAIFASLKLIEFVSNLKVSLSDYIAKHIPSFFYETTQIQVMDSIKFKIMKELLIILKQKEADVLDIDGIKVMRENGSFLIRASNTSSIIRIMAEGDTLEDVKTMMSIAKEELRNVMSFD